MTNKQKQKDYYVISDSDYDRFLERIDILLNYDQYDNRNWELVGGVSTSLDEEGLFVFTQALLGTLKNASTTPKAKRNHKE